MTEGEKDKRSMEYFGVPAEEMIDILDRAVASAGYSVRDVVELLYSTVEEKTVVILFADGTYGKLRVIQDPQEISELVAEAAIQKAKENGNG